MYYEQQLSGSMGKLTMYVYKSVWLVVIGELHYLEKEPSNLRSDFAMVII